MELQLFGNFLDACIDKTILWTSYIYARNRLSDISQIMAHLDTHGTSGMTLSIRCDSFCSTSIIVEESWHLTTSRLACQIFLVISQAVLLPGGTVNLVLGTSFLSTYVCHRRLWKMASSCVSAPGPSTAHSKYFCLYDRQIWHHLKRQEHCVV